MSTCVNSEARDLLMPAFMEASIGHDCDLLVSSKGDVYAVCYDILGLQPIAYSTEFDSKRLRFKPDSFLSIKNRLDIFKCSISRYPELPVPAAKKERKSILDITRSFG